ncbi:hypothetical protein KKB68_00350 [Patescibacteria group bacterium]|nr:hypothetical protein [Patescibacteria group bacterium]
MENLIGILLVIGTLILMNKLRIGASRKKEIFLSNINIQQFEALLFDFCQKENWRITKKEILGPTNFVYLLNVGVWGPKISGAQEIKLNVLITDSSLRIEALSCSLMGQLIDWGANRKNLEKFSKFLLSAQSQSISVSQKVVGISEEFIKKQATLQNQKQKISFWAIILLCFVPVVGIFYMWLKTSWGKKAKIGYTLFFVIVYIIIFLMIINAWAQFQQTREPVGPQSIRDFQREIDKGILRSALNVYFIEHKTYPSSLDALVPEYRLEIPQDPETNTYYDYQLLKEGKDYRICIDFEKKPQECVTSAFEPF